MDPILEFRGVSYEIDGRGILCNISVTVGAGETLVLLGRSGSGKTSMLRLINRLIEPTAGEILFEGTPVSRQDPIALRRRIGYVIQDAGLFPHFTVEENVGLVPRLERRPPAEVRSRVEELLGAMGLAPGEFAKRYPRSLSGGQRQRVGVARALAADPPLLLLDEPFAALDPVMRLELQRQFLELRKRLKKTAVFVTHDVREALAMGTRVALLRNGKLELVATPEEFTASTNDEARAFLEILAA